MLLRGLKPHIFELCVVPQLHHIFALDISLELRGEVAARRLVFNDSQLLRTLIDVVNMEITEPLLDRPNL